MSGEYEFNPALTYEEVLSDLPPELSIVLTHGDHCSEGIGAFRARGEKGGKLYNNKRHKLLTNGESSCWLIDQDGFARVEVFGLQQSQDGGGFRWWTRYFKSHYANLVDDGILEVWDMCNSPDHPPEHGYQVE